MQQSNESTMSREDNALAASVPNPPTQLDVRRSQALALANRTMGQKVVTRSQYLLSVIEITPNMPEPVVIAAAELHAALAGPGPSGLDLRPQSLEVIGDAGLHAKAMAEAMAREVSEDRAVVAAIEALPEHVRAGAQQFNEQANANRDEIFQAYHEGKDAGLAQLAGKLAKTRQEAYDEGVEAGRFFEKCDLAAKPLWRVVLERIRGEFQP